VELIALEELWGDEEGSEVIELGRVVAKGTGCGAGVSDTRTQRQLDQPLDLTEKATPLVRREAPELRPWLEYEEMGLAPAAEKRHRAPLGSRLVVCVYRLVGFGVLTLVVALLDGYIGTGAFYFLNKGWVEPMVVSPSDAQVFDLKAKMAEQSCVRD
jgi:hypothetical protein